MALHSWCIYISRECTLRFHGVPLDEMGSERTSAAAGLPVLRAAAESKIHQLLKDAGLDVRPESITVLDVHSMRLKDGKLAPPHVVVKFERLDLVRQLNTKEVRDKLREQKIGYGINLLPEELANRRYIQSHPKFVNAVGKLPMGVKPLWRLDACCLSKKWRPDAVWTVELLAGSDPHVVEVDV